MSRQGSGARSRITRTAGALAAAGGLGAAWALGVEPRWYALRHVTVPVLRPAAAGALRVLQLSDLHLHLAVADRQAAFAERCAAAGADLVVAAGDLLGGEGTLAATLDVLRRAKGPAQGLAVLGSSDFAAPKAKNPLRYLLPDRGERIKGPDLPTQAFVDALTAEGWHVLQNHRLTIQTPVGTVDVVGLGDPHVQHDDPTRIDWAPPVDDVALRLGLVHAPYRRALDALAEQDLILAAHTHGGQVRVPLYGALATNCDLERTRARGLSREPGGGAWLHVTAGIGANRFTPFRFACRPEAAILDLVAAR